MLEKALFMTALEGLDLECHLIVLCITKANGKLLLTDSFLLGFLAISLWFPSLAPFLSEKARDLGGFCASFLNLHCPYNGMKVSSCYPGIYQQAETTDALAACSLAFSVSSQWERGLCNPHSLFFLSHIRAKANNNLNSIFL